jgi:hypothetical protein
MTASPRQGDQASRRIWYASYGSNLSYQNRFMCYIAGGKPAGSSKTNAGCRDTTPPLDNKPISLDFELYFAGYAESWRGAPAFIRRGSKTAITYGRMYLITDEQFNDVVLQENDREVDGVRFVPPFEELAGEDEFVLPGNRLYGHLLRIGQESGCPVITFTTTRYNLPIGAPSEAYLKIIVSGIKETYPTMTNSEITQYLSHADGVHGGVPLDDLVQWVREAA